MKNSLINDSFKNAKKENRPALLTYTVAGGGLQLGLAIGAAADAARHGFREELHRARGGGPARQPEGAR